MNRTTAIIIGIVAILALALGVWAWQRDGEERDTGVAVNSFEECAEAGYPVMESHPRQCAAPDGRTFTEDIGNELEHADMIRIDAPRPNATVSSPLTVRGEARGMWYFEGSFPVRLYDGEGNELVAVPATAQGEWMTEEFVPFEGELVFPTPSTEYGTLVFEKDNPSGLPEHAAEVRMPIRFAETAAQNGVPDVPQTMTVLNFYSNTQLDPDPNVNCEAVFPVERTVPRTEGVARATLEELLKGPSAEEQGRGYETNIPDGVTLQRVQIIGGTARVDFSAELDQVGGSCRIAAIQAQIRQTLLQFPSVNNVSISIDGRTEDILQP